jgi:hypothetical protein
MEKNTVLSVFTELLPTLAVGRPRRICHSGPGDERHSVMSARLKPTSAAGAEALATGRQYVPHIAVRA